VKYCSDECQNNHREQHEEECKKRLAELRDKDLFTQPNELHLGGCPICCLPLPIDETKSTVMPCCSKYICRGCDYANAKREIEAGLQQRCVFCREPSADTEEEAARNCMKRVKKNDPAAMYQMGNKHYREGDFGTAFKYFTKAAGLGDAEAHFQLSELYFKGLGVVEDKEKTVYHWEEAAIAGHPEARKNLGIVDRNCGRFERAVKHFIIAANLGDDGSLQALRQLYADGYATKEDYAGALRAYQTAVDATKSEEREKTEKAIKNGEISFAF
jgi:TPR repeat protein